jgi:phenylpyruvate tautomerase PptA (4-oxalocrotonate tautomerase family)
VADQIERIIYKTEIDDAGYIKGIDALSASTKRFADNQKAANDTLKTNEQALKQNSERLEKARKDLETYAGTNTKYRQQLEKDVKSAERDQAKLTQLVKNNQKAYDEAAKSAQNFANISARATTVQQQTTGGKLPIVPPPGIVPPIAQTINVSQLTDLPDIINATTDEFEQLRTAIAAAEAQLATLDQESEEFKQIAPVVAQAKESLKLYDDAAKKSAGSTQSLRAQLRLGREELVKLEQQGKANTKQYTELELKVAKLTDEFSDQQARIKILASDTKLLDFGKGAITAATAAFQTYASVAILVGGENEELQKKTMQLFAAMQLLQSLEQLSNLTRREGILSTLGLSGAQSVYTAVVGASTGALRVFRLALLGTGIGTAIAAIGYLVIKYNEMADAASKAGEKQKILGEISAAAADSYGKERAELEVLVTSLKVEGLSRKEKFDIVDKLQKQFPGYFDNIKTEKDLNDKLAIAYQNAAAGILSKARAQAGQDLLGQTASERLKRELELADRIRSINNQVREEARLHGGKVAKIVKESADNQRKIAAQEFSKDVEDIDRRSKIILDAILADNAEIVRLGGKVVDPQKEKEKKEIENEFARKKSELDQKLAEVTRKEAEDESKIRVEFAKRLAKEQLDIAELLKDKKLTKKQAGILDAEAIQINKLELDKALADFRKKITDAREKISDELRDLENKNIQDQINLIQDEFDKRAVLIEFNEKRELEAAKENTQDRLDSLELDRLLLGEQAYQDAKAKIISAGELNALNILRRFAIERQDLAADSFKRILDAYKGAIAQADLIRDEGIATQIRNVSDRFLQGKISYEQFQKEITKIQKDAEAIRRDANLATQRAELKALDDRIAAIKDKASKEAKELEKARDELRGKIASADKADATQDVEDVVGAQKARIDVIVSYTNSIGQLADSVVAFWQKANEAESKALDRSISLQEKRVAAAQRIAERGNAEYLKAEEDRLTELNIKRENAARRQLAIDAALQASQILVGITGAIAKIATPGIGIAETIGAMAVIVGSLAAGYGLVKSLQGNQPRLAEGTTYLSRGKNRPGKDTIPAWLNEGEAVIPTETNKAYHPTIKAVYDGTVPPETLNTFVRNYHKLKSIPQPDYARIKETAELKINSDGKMAVAISEQNKLIMENNDLQRQTLRAMSKMSVKASIDRDGVAIMVNEFLQAKEIDKKR